MRAVDSGGGMPGASNCREILLYYRESQLSSGTHQVVVIVPGDICVDNSSSLCW